MRKIAAQATPKGENGSVSLESRTLLRRASMYKGLAVKGADRALFYSGFTC